MKKAILVLMSICSCMTFVSCGKEKDNGYTFVNSYEVSDSYFSKSEEISNIKITNVPKEEIEIGYFGHAGITLEVNYVNGDKETYPITEKFFSEDIIGEFLVPGDKYFDIVYKGNHLPLKFTLVPAKVLPKYEVNFYDRFGNIVETKYVSYLSSTKCSNHALFGPFAPVLKFMETFAAFEIQHFVFSSI